MSHRSLRRELFGVFGALALAACFDADLSSGGAGLGGPDAGTNADSDGSAARDAGHDAASSDAADDAGDGDANGANRHASCSASLPRTLPQAPELPVGDDGGPLFDDWWDPSICGWPGASAPWPCDRDLVCPSAGRCVQATPDELGFCVGEPNAALGDAAWLYLPEFNCGVTMTNLEKMLACCAGVFDCAELARKKRPGEECASHDDCEAGLLCKAEANWSYGVCVCPDVDPKALDVRDCSFPSIPKPWGRDAVSLEVGTCSRALAPGWREYVLTETTSSDIAAIAVDGHVDVFYVTASGLQRLRRENGAWSGSAILSNADRVHSAAVGPNGDVRVSYCSDTDGLVSHRVDGPTDRPDAACSDVESSFDSASGAALVYYATDGTWLARLEQESGWMPQQITEQPGFGSPAIAFDDSDVAHVVTVRDGFMDHFAIDGDDIAEEPLGGGVASMHLVRSATGPLALAWADYGVRVEYALLDDVVSAPRTVWEKTENGVAYENPRPRLAFGPDGEPMIAHRAPGGLSLATVFGEKWTSTPIIAEAPNAELVVDDDGVPHLLYVVTIAETSGLQLRHAMPGTCP